MKLLSVTEYGVNVRQAQAPILICKFSETEYCVCFPKSSGVTDRSDPFAPTTEDQSIFRGDLDTDDFYPDLESLKAQAMRAVFGGPEGDMSIDLTKGRYFEVLGVLVLDHLEA